MTPSKPIGSPLKPVTTEGTSTATTPTPKTSGAPNPAAPAFSQQKFNLLAAKGSGPMSFIARAGGANEVLEVCGIRDTVAGLIGRIEEHMSSDPISLKDREILNNALC